VDRLWAYLDGELGEVDRDRVDAHLALCRRCCGELEFARRLRGLLASAAAPHLPPDVDSRLTAFLDQLEEPTWNATPP
jgi:anti-sigma factor RsiW